MGVVYSAEHESLGKRFALKFMRSEVASKESTIRRFEREAELLARVDHENIVGLIDLGSDGPLRYLVLEFVRGNTLRREMSSGRLPVSRILAILTQIARGLGAAHEAGVVHRDLKPENVMLTEHADGSVLVKLLDFGVARLYEDGESVTVTGHVPGTAGYMSPEQARGELELDARSDVHALGVMTYECLAGSRPFDGSSYNETLFRVLNLPHSPLSTRRPDLPSEIDSVIDRALAKHARDRYRSPWEFVVALRDVLKAEATSEPDDSQETLGEHVAASVTSTGTLLQQSSIPRPWHEGRAVVVGALLTGLVCGGGAALAWRIAQPSGAPATQALSVVPAPSLLSNRESSTPGTQTGLALPALPTGVASNPPSAERTSGPEPTAIPAPTLAVNPAPTRNHRVPAFATSRLPIRPPDNPTSAAATVPKPAATAPTAAPASGRPTSLPRLHGDYELSPYVAPVNGAKDGR
jgi:serine/threonine-protein kinase